MTYSLNTERIYEIILNLIQRHVDKVRKPTYRLMQHCGPHEYLKYNGEGWQLFAQMVYRLPVDNVNCTFLERITVDYKQSEYTSKRKFQEHIKILINKSLVCRLRNSTYVINPEYIPSIVKFDMEFINKSIMPATRKVMLEKYSSPDVV